MMAKRAGVFVVGTKNEVNQEVFMILLIAE
jgi:hypothetical protein